MSLPKSAINPGQYTYSYGDRVEYDISSGIDNIVRGKGTIVGVTSNYFPFMGAIYAVEADDLLSLQSNSSSRKPFKRNK